MDCIEYKTKGGILVERNMEQKSYANGVDKILNALDNQLGVLLVSNFEYPGRYARFDIGFVNPPLQFVANGNKFSLKALNQRGNILLEMVIPILSKLDVVNCNIIKNSDKFGSGCSLIDGEVIYSTKRFPEELRSKQPSIFSVIRAITDLFASESEQYLGLYGAFGYDVAFQFEKIKLQLERNETQRDVVLYLPDQILVVDHRKETAIEYSYDFIAASTIVDKSSTSNTYSLPRDGIKNEYVANTSEERYSDHSTDEYINIVKAAKKYFKCGDLFEVVPGRTFFDKCLVNPSKVFLRLKERNPSPYSFFINLGEMEYLVGASPEMYVRVTGKRVETCPISGTIARGRDAIEDADNILKLFNSKKDESELTMCTDVDRNDKSRVCEPGSVQVIGRRQLELYSRLIHTVDHVEGILKDGYDAIDAFLTHTWAVTVTGAPKTSAMQFIENHEKSARLWYGGAVGFIGFDGNMNTGLTIRTVRIKNGVSEVRAGATLLYDSIPEEEEAETKLKASAMLDAVSNDVNDRVLNPSLIQSNIGKGKKALLVDHQDSFVHTLSNYFRQTGMEVITLRNEFSLDELKEINPDLVVLSPGPGRPNDFNLSETIAMCLELNIPIFGVCLGLQGIVEYFGGELAILDYPMHGKKVSVTNHTGKLLDGLPNEFHIGLYHSLYADKATFPATLNILAESEFGIIMAIEHKNLPIWAVQFHPESILTLGDGAGFKIIENVVGFLQ